MKLWYLTLKDEKAHSGDYDVVVAAVVAAPDEASAKRVNPSDANRLLPAANERDRYKNTDTWTNDPEDVKAELIGTAIRGTKTGCVLAQTRDG